jgi:ribosome recycling factor
VLGLFAVMYKELINQRKKDFDAVVEWAKGEIAGIRTGRAHSSMVEDLVVDYMGSKLRIKELATITTPEPRVIFVQPWDKGAIPFIEKAIKDRSLGLNPMSDSNGVRLTIPSLTEERRKEFSKLLHQKAEEARIKSRQIREDILKKVQSAVKEKTAREDELKNTKEEVQKKIDEFNKKIDEMVEKKETELML